MKNCKVLQNENILFNEVKLADHFFSRLVGLLRTKGLSDQQGLLLKKCSQVHTFGMKFPIDAVFLSENGNILFVENELEPGKVTANIKKAYWVLEIKSGSANKNQLKVNDQLTIRQ